jgi:hypothetical protein
VLTTARLLLLDVYAGLTGVPRGAVKYLRVMEDVPKPWGCQESPAHGDTLGLQNPVISLGGHFTVKKVHGVVPVREDGSAYFEVPAGKNLYLQALDEDYLELQRMRTFVNLQPGEVRSCVGCHEPRSQTPSNRPAAALRAGLVALAPQPGDAGPRLVHFARDVQPTLDQHCVRCHSPADPQGGLDLSGTLTTLFDTAYENLLNRGLVDKIDVDPRGAYIPAEPPLRFGSHRSKLIDVLRAGHYGIKLEREEFIRLVTWIDANAPYYGTYDGRRNLQARAEPDFRIMP